MTLHGIVMEAYFGLATWELRLIHLLIDCRVSNPFLWLAEIRVILADSQATQIGAKPAVAIP